MSCDRAPTAPLASRRFARIALDPQFTLPPSFQPGVAADVVPFDRVRIVLHHDDGALALDTVVVFPDGVDSLDLTLVIPLSATAGPAGEAMSLNMAYVNAAGDTVFRGGPIPVTAAPPGVASGSGAVDVPVRYTGPGANAARVVISPRTLRATGGGPFEFSAAAVDGSGVTLGGTPIVWSSLDPARATIDAPSSGRGTTQDTRGSARIVAQLLTGPADTVALDVQPRPRRIALVSGDVQSGAVTRALAQPVVVRVTASDGLPVADVPVQFTVLAGGGTVSPASVNSDENGLAQTVWTLGTLVGTQQLSATYGPPSGTPVTVTATGLSVAPVRLAFTAQPPAAVGAAVTMGAVAVTAFDAQDVAATTFTGNVTVALTAGPPGTLLGTTTVAAAAGVATFSDLRLNAAATGYSFSAGATGLPSVTSNPFDVTTGAPANLAIVGTPVGVFTAGATLPDIVVRARDAVNNPIPTFTGPVTIAIASGPTGANLTVTRAVNAVAGLATFSSAMLDLAGDYTLSFTSAGLAPVTSPAFTIVPGPAASLTLESGSGQVAPAGTTLSTIAVRVADAFGNGVGGHTIAFNVTSGGGSLALVNAVTDIDGVARVNWTLGAVLGAQSISANDPALVRAPLVITATASTGGVSPIASTTVAPKPDSLFSFGDIMTLTATARDNANAVVAGAFTWASRNPAAVTVSAAGVVTAVANGSAFVVATEGGGTRDSALVVVQQRVATINIAPSARNIYLTRNYQFTASVVDGRGNPVAGAGAVTWSSLSPALAPVDVSGTVTAVSLGSTQVRASLGAVVGAATVNVITPITRIIVGRDSIGVPVTDTTSVTALGLGRAFRAVARDTLDAPMAGVTFTWTSTNSSVALLDTIAATRATVNAAANGITAIQASAQGVTGTLALTVAQTLAAIELTPPAAAIAPTGTVQLTARGKDANNRYIPGGAFTYASSATGIATVNAAGVVTGVAVGTSNLTASSGVITSPATVISVSNSVPPLISFGRDTLAVGRGANTSIPILLSRPNASPVTVNLAVRDTNAFFSTATVVIPANATSANATLNGRNAGTTEIYATDGSGTGYAGDTAVATVQARIQFAQSGWSLNATDEIATQVLLSDPSPAGGTFVTFTYGTPGRGQVSPDPAFIPAGQLAADVIVRALSAGSTTITPGATGVNGTAATLSVSVPVLTISATSIRVGAGQYEPNVYAYLPQYTNTAVPVTITSSDTTVAVATPSLAIPVNSYYSYFTTTARNPGTARIITSAAGFAPDTLVVVVTSPYVGICCGNTLNTTSPLQNVTIYAEDSVRASHNRANSLTARVSSSDTTVIRVLDTVVTINVGQAAVGGVRIQPGGAGGQAWVKVTASGHAPDSISYTVIGPKLSLSFTSVRTGAGQYEPNVYVSTPDYLAQPLTVRFTNPNPAVGFPPDSLTIPSGTYYSYFNLTGVSPGTITFIASATGYQPDTASLIVTSPRVTGCCATTINAFGPGTSVTVYSTDSTGSTHYRPAPLTVSLVSTNPSVLDVDSSAVTIVPGAYFNNRARVIANGVGTASIIVTAPGHQPDTIAYTVQSPKLNFSFTSTRLGRRQTFENTDIYLSTPDYRTSPLAITLTQKQPGVVTLPSTSVTIPNGIYYQYFALNGIGFGTDTIIATAPGYVPDTAFVTVTTPHIVVGSLPGSATTTNPPSGMTVYATDSLGSAHYSMDTLVIHAVSSDSTVIKPASPYIRLPKDQYFINTTALYVGAGTASITYSDSAGTGYVSATTNTVTVTGPSLFFSSGSVRYGMRQRSGPTDVYVYTQNAVASPLTVNLVSTDTRVATVAPTVTIPAGLNYAYFVVTGQDTLGTVQVQATATGYSPATPMSAQVTVPKFVVSTSSSLNTTSPASAITVYATDANGTAHYVTEDVAVTLISSAPGVANPDSTTVTLTNGSYFTNAARLTPLSAGTTQITATDGRAAFYKYGTGAANVQVFTPSLGFSWTNTPLGIGQYIDVYVAAPDYQTTNLGVGLTHSGAARTSTPSNVTIPSSTYYVYFRVTGTASGTDTLVANSTSGATHLPDSAFTAVGVGRVDPISNWPGTLRAGDSVQVTLYARDPADNVRNVAAATTFTLSPNSNIEFRTGGAASTVITSVTIPADQTFVSFWVKGLTAGAGSVTITNGNYTTYTVGVTITP